MKLETKYEQIKESAIKDARVKANDIISSFEETLNDRREKYIKEATKDQQISIMTAKKNASNMSHKTISNKTSDLKKELLKKYYSYKNTISELVKLKLQEYMTTPDYYNLLIDWIKRDLEFIDQNDIIISYINSTDSELLDRLKKDTDADIQISDTNFIGGIKSIITNRNILIDHSFETKLKLINESNNFDQGDINGELF